MELLRRTALVATLATLGFASASTVAQTAYPTRPVKLQVPFAPGGTTDIIARVIAEPLGKVLGQPVVIENKAGGGGVVGATETVRATPDGYSLGMATVSTTAANPAINPKIPYNPVTDFTPIINIAATPNLIAVHPSFPARDYKAFIDELKSRPGKYSYASSGTGGIGHLQTELFKSLAGVFMTHIPYRGTGPQLTDLLAGRTQASSAGLPALMPHIKSGKLRALGVSSAKRSAAAPEVPAIAESGFDFDLVAWFMVYAPAATPAPVLARLRDAAAQTLANPEVAGKLKAQGLEPSAMRADELPAFGRAELSKWADLVRRSGAQVD